MNFKNLLVNTAKPEVHALLGWPRGANIVKVKVPKMVLIGGRTTTFVAPGEYLFVRMAFSGDIYLNQELNLKISQGRAEEFVKNGQFVVLVSMTTEELRTLAGLKPSEVVGSTTDWRVEEGKIIFPDVGKSVTIRDTQEENAWVIVNGRPVYFRQSL